MGRLIFDWKNRHGAGVTQRAQRTGAYITNSGTPSAQSGSSGRAAHGQHSSSNYAHAQLPLFQPLPESQPVLPCLLRRLLQQVGQGFPPATLPPYCVKS